MSIRHVLRAVLLAGPSLLMAAPASAHHVMGGKLPSTWLEGLLSGLGHPLIGPEHLGFLLAVAVVVGACGLSLALPAVFVAAMAAGVALHVIGFAFPAVEVMVALSTLLAGLLIAGARSLPVAAWAALFAAAGILHGYAFGESIYGAETAPLGAYLAGLILIQTALTTGLALAVRRMGTGLAALAPRLAGAAVFGIGFAALIGQLIPAA
ncbi:MAG: urease accessory protein UreJ [Alphaproteobacteria bacterium]|jgi:urease accessory protein|nr:MAG: urease accessory protein UreJ [Alphaproteobacteria bacterium]